MSLEILEKLPPLAPLDFFSVEAPLFLTKTSPSLRAMRKDFLLPSTSEWLYEESFCDVALAWNPSGIYVAVFVNKPLEEVVYPRFSEGDAIELFFDTRDLKEAGFATKFCHHFVFLPRAVQGIHAQEITRFRSEDTHPFCDSLDLQITTTSKKKEYEALFFIPSHCLYGFDPSSFERMGFTYRIHRFKGKPQHFVLNSTHFPLEQHPRLWASFIFKQET